MISSEKGSAKPTAEQDPSWQIFCPVMYCSANPGNPCMNNRGYFLEKTHDLRIKAYGRVDLDRNGPGTWNKRPIRKTYHWSS